jgi:hypothetical protein
VYHRRDGLGNIVSEIYAGDGSRAYGLSIYSKTVASEITKEDLFKDIASSLKMELGDITGIEKKANSVRGQTLAGPTKDLLDAQANDAGVYWSMQNEEVIAFPKTSSIGGPIIGFDSTNGMINSPVITEIGINLEVLLNPLLKPGSLFQVKSIAANISFGNYYFRAVRKTVGEGTYRIDKLIFKGDTHGDAWTSEIEGFILI